MACQNVPLPTESTGQAFLTPIVSTASTAVDISTGSIFEVHTVDNDDEQWLSETNCKSGWNTRFKSGTHRGMLYGVVLRDYPKYVVSLISAGGVPANMREFLSWTHEHYRIEATISTIQRGTGEPTCVVSCPSGCKEFSRKGSKGHFVRSTCKIRGTVRKERRTPRLDPNIMFSTTHRLQGEQLTHEKDMSRRSWNLH